MKKGGSCDEAIKAGQHSPSPTRAILPVVKWSSTNDLSYTGNDKEEDRSLSAS